MRSPLRPRPRPADSRALSAHGRFRRHRIGALPVAGARPVPAEGLGLGLAPLCRPGERDKHPGAERHRAGGAGWPGRSPGERGSPAGVPGPSSGRRAGCQPGLLASGTKRPDHIGAGADRRALSGRGPAGGAQRGRGVGRRPAGAGAAEGPRRRLFPRRLGRGRADRRPSDHRLLRPAVDAVQHHLRLAGAEPPPLRRRLECLGDGLSPLSARLPRRGFVRWPQAGREEPQGSPGGARLLCLPGFDAGLDARGNLPGLRTDRTVPGLGPGHRCQRRSPRQAGGRD